MVGRGLFPGWRGTWCWAHQSPTFLPTPPTPSNVLNGGSLGRAYTCTCLWGVGVCVSRVAECGGRARCIVCACSGQKQALHLATNGFI